MQCAQYVPGITSDHAHTPHQHNSCPASLQSLVHHGGALLAGPSSARTALQALRVLRCARTMLQRTEAHMPAWQPATPLTLTRSQPQHAPNTSQHATPAEPVAEPVSAADSLPQGWLLPVSSSSQLPRPEQPPRDSRQSPVAPHSFKQHPKPPFSEYQGSGLQGLTFSTRSSTAAPPQPLPPFPPMPPMPLPFPLPPLPLVSHPTPTFPNSSLQPQSSPGRPPPSLPSPHSPPLLPGSTDSSTTPRSVHEGSSTGTLGSPTGTQRSPTGTRQLRKRAWPDPTKGGARPLVFHVRKVLAGALFLVGIRQAGSYFECVLEETARGKFYGRVYNASLASSAGLYCPHACSCAACVTFAW